MTPEQIENVTKGMSRNAADLWRIAVKIAGFDPVELLAEVCRAQRAHGKVTEPTVAIAIQRVRDHDAALRPELYREEMEARDRARAQILRKETRMT